MNPEEQTEIEALRARVAEMERAIAEVRHDLNNALSVVIGRAQILAFRTKDLPESVKKNVSEILQASERLLDTLKMLERLKGAASSMPAPPR